jgi:hypothetical protein
VGGQLGHPDIDPYQLFAPWETPLPQAGRGIAGVQVPRTA